MRPQLSSIRAVIQLSPDRNCSRICKQADGLILTGSETDVCILATAIGAVDLGYRVILVRDAVCSSSDAGHDALMQMYHRRYTEQIEMADGATRLRLSRNLSAAVEFLRYAPVSKKAASTYDVEEATTRF